DSVKKFQFESAASLYGAPSAVLTRPLLIGEFSCNPDLTTTANSLNRRYLINMDEKFKPTFDLNAGFERYVKKDPDIYSNDLRKLQEWAIFKRNHYDYESNHELFYEAEIVSCRGVLTNIARTPFQNDSWRIVAVRHNGIIYLHDCGAVDGRTFVTRDEKQARSTYWGHHFHRCMTTSRDGRRHVGEEDVVDTRQTFNSIFRSDIIIPDENLTRLKLTYAAEIKAVDNNNTFIDFRTCYERTHPNDWKSRWWFWWIQSHLVGVDRIYVGFKNENGIVRRVKMVKRTALKEHSAFQCTVAMNFLAKVLLEIKNQCDDSLQISHDRQKVFFEPADRDKDFLIEEFTKLT
ncbi:hypothetical protein PMAYCL1PPCAC_06349, partial [Pristionchus mayeri]